MTLRAYQQSAHDAVMAWVVKSTYPCVVEAATGAGKSHLIAALAKTVNKNYKKRILCIAPSAELVLQNAEKYALTGSPFSIFSASAGQKSLRYPVVFGTPVTIKNKIEEFGSEFAMIIVDECFPAGTLISTPRGPVEINSLRSGDTVYNATGTGTVLQKMTKAVSEIYEVEIDDGTRIKCTGNHPFFTRNGWIEARAMVAGTVLFSEEDVSVLRGGVWADEVLAQRKEADVSSTGKALEQANHLLSVLRKEAEKPHAQPREQGQDGFYAESDWTCPEDPWRERTRPNGKPTSISHGTGAGMGNGGGGECLEREADTGYSEPLQDRHSASSNENSDRGGRQQSLLPSQTPSGREKGYFLGGRRVVSVSSVKLDSPEIVYNIHVSGHPSYFAEGVLVHNCHGITPTIIAIIDEIRAKNPLVRVVGLTATPYRMMTGYIFAQFPNGKAVSEHRTKSPYFEKCVYRITARELIDMGYLTPPVVGTPLAEGYQTLDMNINKMGQFDAGDIERAFVGQGRKTSRIIGDIVAQSQGREGVMIFASTVRHAHECLQSLPPALSAIVTGETKRAERVDILNRFKAREIKYLVNVSVLTTGFDAPHVDLIALLRATESPGLLQQIIGRGLRISRGKEDCKILDYAENLERHFPDGGDIFYPNIEVVKATEKVLLTCVCPTCKMENEFAGRPNPAGFEVDINGYFVDLDGYRIQSEEYGDMPAHYGRRCQTRDVRGNDIHQCDYRWTTKDCPHCGAENDIAARYCEDCKGEIVDPNEKLRLAFKAKKKDPTQVQCDEVTGWSIFNTLSSNGNPVYRVNVTTTYRTFAYWVIQQPKFGAQASALQQLMLLHGQPPKTITYRRNKDNAFYNVLGYNRPKDEDPSKNTGVR